MDKWKLWKTNCFHRYLKGTDWSRVSRQKYSEFTILGNSEYVNCICCDLCKLFGERYTTTREQMWPKNSCCNCFWDALVWQTSDSHALCQTCTPCRVLGTIEQSPVETYLKKVPWFFQSAVWDYEVVWGLSLQIPCSVCGAYWESNDVGFGWTGGRNSCGKRINKTNCWKQLCR